MEQTIKEAALGYINSEHEKNFYMAGKDVTLDIFGNKVDVESIWFSEKEDKVYLHCGCREFEADIDIESLSERNQRTMMMVFWCAEPKEAEFFSIEDYGRGKQVHVLGCCYIDEDYGEGPWRNVEYTGFIEPLEDFVGHLKDDGDYVYNRASELKQYIDDLDGDSIVEMLNRYFDGHRPDGVLDYSAITKDTPCGDYVF